MKRIFLSGLLFCILVLAGCAQQKVSLTDFSVRDFKYEEDRGGGRPIHWDSENSKIRAEASFIVNSNRDGLNFRAWDAIHDVELIGKSEYRGSRELRMGDNKFHLYSRKLFLDNLKQEPQIEICVSNEEDFNKNSPGVVCKIETFSAPNIDVSVTPDPLTFTVSKENTFDLNYKTITIENTGDIEMSFYVYQPSYAGPYEYAKDYPQYMTKDQSHMYLAPGESKTYSIAPSIGNIGEFDTAIGLYDSVGYVWAITTTNSVEDALFKKEFKLKTDVVE